MMSIKAFVLLSLSSATFLACASSRSVVPDKDPWASYQGTYATSLQSGDTHVATPPDVPDDERVAKSAPKTKVDPSAPEPSTALIQDASISSIGVTALGEASARSLGLAVVATDLVVGSKYELVEVQLKGATVQILRAAQAPNAAGPELAAPHDREGELSPTEAGWYDADADVLVVVNSAKRATSDKLLAALFHH
jgi:hypothetical protein